ncbi:opacity family porin [Rodentibacter pneumotropicus]|uniref:Porin opacity type domain-containing protein n=1 Tax=Rodentibacter pneumotropicus TaxID=758 RepID=A0A4S2Q3V0_9PAST|nr:opacity family porin [Rodentibacter pneumotropicus]THA10517.1 hypothetical protein D3M78_03190 [Rodentibacter pneumotropicus]
MKKLLISTLLVSASLSAQAGNFYIQGDLGVSRIEASPDDEDYSIGSTVFDQRLSFGYDFKNQFRLAIDYHNFNKAELDEHRVKIKSLGITGFYDFEISNKDFIPYVGVRIAHNKAKITEEYCGYSHCYSNSYSSSSGGVGIIGGIQYKLSSNLNANVAIELNRLASDVAQGGIKIGLRYNF